MVIQTPGSFLWAGSLAARLGAEGWSTWGIYLVTGCLQGCLLVMGIYFEIEARKRQQEAEDVNVESYTCHTRIRVSWLTFTGINWSASGRYTPFPQWERRDG
jgi:hypothetical protein